MSYAMFISDHARHNKFHTCIRIWNDPMTKKLVESIYNHFNNQSINSIIYWPICNQGRLAYEKTENSAKELHARAREISNKRMVALEEEEEEPKRKITRASLKWWRMLWLLEASSPLYDIAVIPFSPWGFLMVINAFSFFVYPSCTRCEINYIYTRSLGFLWAPTSSW